MSWHITNCSNKPLPRSQRVILRTQVYQYTIKYISGATNTADCLSCHPLKFLQRDTDKFSDHHIYDLVGDASSKTLTLDHLEYATQNNSTLQDIMKFIYRNKWTKTAATQHYMQIRNELSAKPWLLLKGNLIRIP